jgi:hypothetical protein
LVYNFSVGLSPWPEVATCSFYRDNAGANRVKMRRGNEFYRDNAGANRVKMRRGNEFYRHNAGAHRVKMRRGN